MKRCIVVDDDELNRDIACHMLETLGFDAHGAADVYEAFPYTKMDDISVMLVDWNMPGMDGPTFLKKIRNMDHCKELPILLYSALEESDVSSKAAECQADGFICKPFTLEKLEDKFRSLGLA